MSANLTSDSARRTRGASRNVRALADRLGRMLIGAADTSLGRLAATGRRLGWRLKEERELDDTIASTAWLIEEMIERVGTVGHGKALRWLEGHIDDADRLAVIVIEVARDIRSSFPHVAYHLCIYALGRSPKIGRAKWLSFALFDAGFVAFPSTILGRMDLAHLRPSERRRVEQIKSLQSGGVFSPPMPGPGIVLKENRSRSAVWWTRQSLPYHLTSQTLRSAAAVAGLMERGWQVRTVTEPGHTSTGDTCLEGIQRESFGGHDYVRLSPMPTTTGDFSALGVILAERLIDAVEGSMPRVIISDADFVFCQAGLYAARRSGAKFVLDLAEITAPWLPPVETEQSNERSSAVLREIALVAGMADGVIVRSQAIANALMERGVPRELLVHIPDPVLEELDKHGGPIRELAELPNGSGPVLGHIGYISPARGFLELISALDRLAGDRVLSLMLAGTVQNPERILEAAKASGLADRLFLPGRVAPESYRQYAEAIDIWIEPPPLTMIGALATPFELEIAMSLGKPIVAPDLPIFREKLADHRGCWFYSSEPHEIADTIRSAVGEARKGGQRQGRPNRISSSEDWNTRYERLLARLLDS